MPLKKGSSKKVQQQNFRELVKANKSKPPSKKRSIKQINAIVKKTARKK